jgi:CspA family cold shock protein
MPRKRDREEIDLHTDLQAAGNVADDYMVGTLKRVVRARGFGFVVTPAGQDYFLHYSEVKTPPFDSLNEGDRIRFRPERTPKGLRAVDASLAE